jgi:predicted  nucleic acid-binding Zn-ribbon protein
MSAPLDFDKVKAAYDEVAMARRARTTTVGSTQSGGMEAARPRGDSEMSAVIVDRNGTPTGSSSQPRRMMSGQVPGGYSVMSPPVMSPVMSPQVEVIASSNVGSNVDTTINPFETFPAQTRMVSGESAVIGINSLPPPPPSAFKAVIDPSLLNGNRPSVETIVVGTPNVQPTRSISSESFVVRSASNPEVVRVDRPEIVRSSIPENYSINGGVYQPYLQKSERPMTRGIGESVVVGGTNALGSYAGPTQGSAAVNGASMTRGIGESVVVGGRNALGSYAGPTQGSAAVISPSPVLETVIERPVIERPARVLEQPMPTVRTLERPTPRTIVEERTKVTKQSPRESTNGGSKHGGSDLYLDIAAALRGDGAFQRGDEKHHEKHHENGTHPVRMKSAVGTLDAKMKYEYDDHVHIATSREASDRIMMPSYMQSYDPDRTLPPANYIPRLSMPPEREIPPAPPAPTWTFEARPPEVPEMVPEPDHHVHYRDLDSGDHEYLKEELERVMKEHARWKAYVMEAGSDSAQSLARKIQEVRSWGASEYNTLLRKKESLEKEKENLEQKYGHLKKQVSDEEHKVKRLEYEVHQGRQDIANREDKIARERRDVDEMKKGHSNLKNEVQRAQREIPDAEGQIRRSRQEQNSLRQRIERLSETLQGNGQLKERLHSAREQRIEDEIAIMHRANRALEIEIDTFRLGTYMEQPPPGRTVQVRRELDGSTVYDELVRSFR